VLTTTAVAWALAFLPPHRQLPQRISIRNFARLGAEPGPLDPRSRRLPRARRHRLQLDIRGALNKGLLEIVFVFFFVDLFDNLGTLVAVTKRAGLIAADHSIPRLNKILLADATATVFGSLTGTSTVTSYVESTAGVMAGGRSGVTAIVTGLLFLGAIGAAPFVGIVPPQPPLPRSSWSVRSCSPPSPRSAGPIRSSPFPPSSP
jgi:xanthine/uracil/vitamin C permease (AzgA family)